MAKSEVYIDAQACKSCGYCSLSCKQGVFRKGDVFNDKGYQAYVPVNPEKCVGCLACFYVCPDFAVSIGGHNATSL
jgi:NAD-dependent dihydropyrimidine dehydrogenase PreA subunit